MPPFVGAIMNARNILAPSPVYRVGSLPPSSGEQSASGTRIWLWYPQRSTGHGGNRDGSSPVSQASRWRYWCDRGHICWPSGSNGGMTTGGVALAREAT